MNPTDLFKRADSAVRRRVAQAENDRTIRAMAQLVALNAPKASQPPVVMFNASTRLSGLSLNAAFSMLTGWALRLSGVPVVHFVCEGGLSRCVLGTKREDPNALPPCRECTRQSQAVYTGADARWFEYHMDPAVAQALQNLPLAELETLEVEGLPLGQLVLPSLRWILRRHHLQDDEPTRFLYRQYLLSAWWVAQEFGRLLDEVKPQAVVVFNGMFYPEATARYLAQQRGLRVISHEVALQPFTGYFTTGEATAYPIDIPAEFELSDAQNARLDEYLEQRFQGNFSMAGIRFWPEMRSLGEAFWQKVGQFKQVVPVFTNVVFDTSQGHANVLFPHMFAWLDAVLEIIKAHPETYFIIRAHPDEGRPGKASLESVAEWVRRSGADQLPNVLFVDSNQFFSSYELIQRSKFVMVYNSTIGLEASLMGAAVLCGGKARFTQIPTVFFPQSAEEFNRQAEEFLAVEVVTAPTEHRRNARRFLYYQLFRTSLPFDGLIEPHPVWKGYAMLRPLNWQALLPENNPTLKIVVDGILKNTPFLLEE